jgi:regulator of RNase E activity RraA
MGSDQQYLSHLQDTLYAAVIADVLDAHGRRNQVLAAGIAHRAGGRTVVGRAATMLACDEAAVVGEPYAAQVAATDALRPGDVVVAAAAVPSGCAFWGELFSTAALARGARGAIVDGLVRDTGKIDALGFPTFASGVRPVDSMGRATVRAANVPIRCGGVVVHPGDLVFAERDGIVVVPAEIEEEVVEAALAKATKENDMRAEIAAGTLLADAWKRHHVL